MILNTGLLRREMIKKMIEIKLGKKEINSKNWKYRFMFVNQIDDCLDQILKDIIDEDVEQISIKKELKKDE